MKTYPLIKHHAMKTCGSRGIVPRILNLRARFEWSVSGPDRFNLGEGAPVIHWRGGWMEPRAGLNVATQRNNLASGGNLNLLVTLLAQLYRFIILSTVRF